MKSFVDSSTRLARARSANHPGSDTPHTVVVLPSYSMGASLLEHYAERIPVLEHRYLLWLLELPRVPAEQIVFVTSVPPARRVIDYYLSLVPPERRRDMRSRFRILVVPDASPRSVTDKLLDRPDLIARLRGMVRGRLAYLEPWNVTWAEMELSRRLGIPMNGTNAELWPLGFKSSGRKLMRRAGVPLPAGREDVRTVDEVVAAAEAIRREHPRAAGVVVKTDDSGTGDGNRVIRFDHPHPAGDDLRAVVTSLEPWYLADLKQGAVVEEFLVGAGFTSPSVQVDIAPDGSVQVLSTHEQLVGGPNGQTYLGCDFPADPAYAPELATYGAAVGKVLAEHGALGRLSVDFAAVQSHAGDWEVYGLEINLRKSGTTHPLSTLGSLVPGRYDDARGGWSAVDGSTRCYRSTDGFVDPALLGRTPEEAITALRTRGLSYDARSGTGVVLHAFCGLDIDGRIGLTAIGTTAAQATNLYESATGALSGLGVPVDPSDPSDPEGLALPA